MQQRRQIAVGGTDVLTETGYALGLGAYVGGGTVLALCTSRWLLPRAASISGGVLLGVVLALLLTPALPRPGMETFAPALVVALFQWFTNGPEAAEHALRPLGLALALGAGLGFCYGLLRRLLTRKPAAD